MPCLALPCFAHCSNVYTLRSKDGSSVLLLLHRRLVDFLGFLESAHVYRQQQSGGTVTATATATATAALLDSGTTLLLTGARVLLSSAAAFCAPRGADRGAASRFMLLPAECSVWQLDCAIPAQAAVVRDVFAGELLPRFTGEAACDNNVRTTLYIDIPAAVASLRMFVVVVVSLRLLFLSCVAVERVRLVCGGGEGVSASDTRRAAAAERLQQLRPVASAGDAGTGRHSQPAGRQAAVPNSVRWPGEDCTAAAAG
jgi:hypothetical protein